MSDTTDTDGTVPPTGPPENGAPHVVAPEDPTSGPTQVQKTMEAILDSPHLYRRVVMWTLIVYGVLTVLSLATWWVILFRVGELKGNLGFWFLLPVLVHLGLSLKVVSTSVVAWYYTFEIPIKKAKTGLRFVPAGVMNLVKLPRNMQEINIPAHQDKIFWEDEKTPLPKGLTRPIFMFTSSAVRGRGGKVKGQAQQSVGVGWFVLWGITHVPNFEANSRSIRETNSQLRKISTAVVSENIAANDLDALLTNLAPFNSHLDDRLRERTVNWGIEIFEVGLFKINPSHEYATAQRDAAKAPFEAEALATAARQKAQERVWLGEADGKAEQARARGPLVGRAEGLERIVSSLKLRDGLPVLAAETARDAMLNAEWGVLGAEGGMRDLMGMAKGAHAALQPRDRQRRTNNRQRRPQPQTQT